ncbi:MAG TPA: 50S ribosomal protein L27 [Patescibacteria group bacterium]|nr:50S ribosomal protein L27 [Patescibacteria group bacterium]
MSTKKQGGKLVQQKRSRPKYLGVKLHDGQSVNTGSIIVKQRGTKFDAGTGVKVGRDHTLFAVKKGKVKFKESLGKKVVSVV